MENKYYTPTIEEFHVGFEYETFEQRWSYQIELIKGDSVGNYTAKVNEEPSVIKDWFKETYCGSDFTQIIDGESIQFNPDINKLRVKYLDQSDINELFKDTYCFKWENDTDFQWVKGGLLYCGIFTKTDSMISFYEDGWESCIFRGNIKNKSELIKLMQQLNIK